MFRRKTSLFSVMLHLDGRHPYLEGNELDFETRDVSMVVPAADWNDAARQAKRVALSIRGWWKCSVSSIARHRA